MRRRNECGSLGGIEGVGFGLLIFVIGTLMITNLWLAVDAKLATDAAAREAVRVYVESDNPQDASNRAVSVAKRTLQGHGVELSNIDIDQPTDFARCSRVIITTTQEVPLVAIPLTEGGGGTRHVSSTHSEVIDPYRSGLKGRSRCL